MRRPQAEVGVYLDACVWLDLGSDSSALCEAARKCIRLVDTPPYCLVTSGMCEVEVLSPSLADLSQMHDLVSVRYAATNIGTFRRAREIRMRFLEAKHGGDRSPDFNPRIFLNDSLHLAAAAQERCRWFVTNDKQVKNYLLVSGALAPMEVITSEDFCRLAHPGSPDTPAFDF